MSDLVCCASVDLDWLAVFVGRRSEGAIEPWEIVVPNAAFLSVHELPDGRRGPTISEGVTYTGGDVRAAHRDNSASTHQPRQPRDRRDPSPGIQGERKDDAWNVQEAISSTVHALVHDSKDKEKKFVRASSWRTPRPPQHIAAMARRQLRSQRGSIDTEEDKMMNRARHADEILTLGLQGSY